MQYLVIILLGLTFTSLYMLLFQGLHAAPLSHMNKKYRTRLQFATLDSKARKKSVTHISDAWPEELTELMNFLSGKIKQFLPKDTTEDLRKQILLAHLKNSPTPQEFVVMQLIVMTFCFL
jgi:phage terminase large subunit